MAESGQGDRSLQKKRTETASGLPRRVREPGAGRPHGHRESQGHASFGPARTTESGGGPEPADLQGWGCSTGLRGRASASQGQLRGPCHRPQDPSRAPPDKQLQGTGSKAVLRRHRVKRSRPPANSAQGGLWGQGGAADASGRREAQGRGTQCGKLEPLEGSSPCCPERGVGPGPG